MKEIQIGDVLYKETKDSKTWYIVNFFARKQHRATVVKYENNNNTIPLNFVFDVGQTFEKEYHTIRFIGNQNTHPEFFL